MMRLSLGRFWAVVALAAGLACVAPGPAAAAEAPGYAIAGATHSRQNYPYLTVDAVVAKLSPAVAAQLPPPDGRRLVLLDVTFRATGGRGDLRELNAADLQVHWTADGARGSAPVLGTHLSKDSISMVGSRGLYTSMRSDTYELFAVVPKAARAIDLAQRQPDGSFKPVRTNIRLR